MVRFQSISYITGQIYNNYDVSFVKRFIASEFLSFGLDVDY